MSSLCIFSSVSSLDISVRSYHDMGRAGGGEGSGGEGREKVRFFYGKEGGS